MKSTVVILAALACFIQNSLGQGFGNGLGFNGLGLPNGLGPGLGLPNGFPGNGLSNLGPGNNFNNLPLNNPGSFGAPCLGNGFGNIGLNGIAPTNLVANPALASAPLQGPPGLPAAAPVGYGDISILGELPVGGNTAVSGNVPVIGYVTFEGVLPAGGLVSVANGCGCGLPPY